jgi:hypothetical protein
MDDTHGDFESGRPRHNPPGRIVYVRVNHIEPPTPMKPLKQDRKRESHPDVVDESTKVSDFVVELTLLAGVCTKMKLEQRWIQSLHQRQRPHLCALALHAPEYVENPRLPVRSSH